MKTLIRKELDIDKPINLRRLSPFLKIYAGILTKWHTTKLYKTSAARSAEKEYIEQSHKDDRLKEVLLAMMYKVLTLNSVLQEKGKVCQYAIISVQNEYAESLERIIGHKDFLPYDIEYVEEQPDIRKAFREMPVLLKVSKKEL